MKYKTTKIILNKLKAFIDLESLKITTVTEDEHDEPYDSEDEFYDVIKIKNCDFFGIDVYKNSVHIWFYDILKRFWSSESNDKVSTEALNDAIDFIEKLLTYPIHCIEKCKVSKKIDRYFIFNSTDNKVLFKELGYETYNYNQHDRTVYFNTIRYYDKTVGRFIVQEERRELSEAEIEKYKEHENDIAENKKKKISWSFGRSAVFIVAIISVFSLLICSVIFALFAWITRLIGCNC